MIKTLCLILIALLNITAVCFADWTPYTMDNSPLETNYLSSLYVSADGRILVGSHGYGLYIKDGDNWSLFNQNNTGVPISYANSITYESDTLFVGSASGNLENEPFGEGLSVLNLADSTWMQYNMGLEINPIITGIERTPEFRAVSTYGGGVTIFNNDGWIRYQTNFRTEFSYADSQQQTFNVDPGTYLQSDYIYGLEYDSQNNILWIASLEGAVTYSEGNWYIYDTDNSGLPSNTIRLIKADPNNTAVYFGTIGYGLVQKIGESWNIYSTGNSPILSNFIYSLEVRPDNSDLWIGTNSGLNVVSPDSSWISYIPPDSNLVEGSFYSDIAFDSSGNVWVSSFGGGMASKRVESEPEDSLTVDVRKLKLFIRNQRPDITWIRAHLEPMVNLDNNDSVSITVSSELGNVYSWNNLFDLFYHVFNHGNLDIYFAYIDGSTVFLKYYNDQNRIKLYLLDWHDEINQDNLIPELNVRIKLGNYVGYDQVFIRPVNLSNDPDIDNFAYSQDDVLLSIEGDPDIVDIDDTETDIIPEAFIIPTNYPNPFNASTRIQFSIAEPAMVKLTVYDILGRIVSIDENYFGAGSHGFEWNGFAKPSGVYFYTLQAAENIFTGKMTLLK